MSDLNNIYAEFGISQKVADLSEKVLASLEERFLEIDKNAEFNQMKVLAAMQKHKVSDIHFAATTGYGYNDLGRDVHTSSDCRRGSCSLRRFPPDGALLSRRRACFQRGKARS